MRTTDSVSAEAVLAVDSSQKIMTVAVVAEKNVIERVEGEKKHSALLLPVIDKALSAAGLTPRDISIFCVVTGTGSFTGLRVGLATLKGLAFGRDARFLTVNTEELAAYYETGKEEEFFAVVREKLKEGRFLSASEVELRYENPETKRFKY